MTDSITTSVTLDNLFIGPYPVVRKSREIGSSETLVVGTVLGIIQVGAVTPAADGGNTGDGTVTAAATVAGDTVAKVGAYVLTCVEAVTNGGVFKLVDPDGNLVEGALILTVGAGAATVFTVAGLTFTVTDGATDFAVADFFTLTVAAGSGYVTTLDKAAIDGSQVFDSVLLTAITTGAAETKLTAVAVSGGFREESLTLGGSTVVGDIRKEARDANCYLYTATDTVGGL